MSDSGMLPEIILTRSQALDVAATCRDAAQVGLEQGLAVQALELEQVDELIVALLFGEL